MNIGIYCGKSRLLVLDEDKAGELARYASDHNVVIPPTFTVVTGRGRHYYFLVPEGSTFGCEEGDFADYAINVKAGNGVVVGPGSTHQNGAIYRIESDVDPAPLPEWVIKGIRSKPARQVVSIDDRRADYLRKPAGLAAVPELIRGRRHDNGGQRHTELVKYAGYLRALRVPLEEATVLYRVVWERCEQPPACLTERTWDEALGTLEDVFLRYPEGRSEASGDAPSDHFDRDVEDALYRLRVRDRAQNIHRAANAGPIPPFDAGTLTEVMARPLEPPTRIEGLIRSDGGTLIVAQRKTGKTTLILNLARSLLTGTDFLGQFTVRQLAGRMGVLNYEVSAAQLARWAADVGVPADRLYLVNVRGRRNPLAIGGDRDRLAEHLREQEVEALIIDPFSRAYSGKNQNDPGEVGAWLADLDRWARGDVGTSDVILSAHAGCQGERTRGASALEDWGDSIITIVRDKRDGTIRYLSAFGRDVEVAEDRLTFDPASRTLRLSGSGSRQVHSQQARVEDLVPVVVRLVTASPGKSGRQIGKALTEAGHRYRKGDEAAAAKLAVAKGKLRTEPGKGYAVLHFPVECPQ